MIRWIFEKLGFTFHRHEEKDYGWGFQIGSTNGFSAKVFSFGDHSFYKKAEVKNA